MYPEPSNQDQNQRKRHTDIFFLRCDFRILFLVTANAMYQDPGEEDEIDQYVLFITEMLLLTEKIQMIVEIGFSLKREIDKEISNSSIFKRGRR